MSMIKMTEAEKKAFEKFVKEEHGGVIWAGDLSPSHVADAFLAGYRAGFSAQHYDVEVRPVAVDELVAALEGMTDHYKRLADSGDCGFWDCEDEDAVKAARAVIAKHKGKA